MAYYGRRRYNPAADERRAREEKTNRRIERSGERFARLMRGFRRVEITSPEESKAAWGARERRSYELGQTRDGIIPAIVRGEKGHLYLQEMSGMGWKFSRLVPRRRVKRRHLRKRITILRKRPSK
jgi:hypothetical protein